MMRPVNEENTVEEKKVEESSKNILLKLKKSDGTKTESPGIDHVAYFADENGNVTKESMQKKFEDLGDDQSEASSKATKIMAFGGLATKYCPFSHFQPEEAKALKHARDTGIWDDKLRFVEERWNVLLTYSEHDNGAHIITEKRFYEFLNWARQNDPKWDPIKIAKMASDAEWTDFWKKFPDYFKGDQKEKAVKIETMDKFFRKDPQGAFKEVEERVAATRRGPGRQ